MSADKYRSIFSPQMETIVYLTPLEVIHDTRDSVRKVREAHLKNKAMAL